MSGKTRFSVLSFHPALFFLVWFSQRCGVFSCLLTILVRVLVLL